MPTTLLLRLPGPGQQDSEWLAVDASGLPTGPRQHGTLEAAAEAARDCKVIALAPATQILLAEPELPPGSGAKLARAIPFALEEQLTEDIDQLSFAVGRRSERGMTPVAVVSREILQGWIAMLAQAGIDPIAIHADVALMPDNPGQTVLWLEGDRLSVRRPDTLPITIEMTPVAEALAVTGIIDVDAAGGDAKTPENALLYVTAEDWSRVQDEFEQLLNRFASLNVQILPDGPLPWFARQLATSNAVNLLQGEFTRSTDYGSHWRAWRTAAALSVGLLVVHIAVQALQIRQANRQSAAADQEISQVFSMAMPSEPMHDARQQMQSRLEKIRKAQAGPQYFLRMVQALGGATNGLPQVSIDALSFREQTLDMKVTATNVESLSTLTQSVARQGLTAEIQSSTPAGTGVEAHLQIRAPRSSVR
ncbi:MAG: type II secretion system protein GspL [Steroidobacterales bacterium]